ncbi:MAG TPA: hypothetical protein VGV37_02385 [Aliidongia sp.]|uniref:TY-Chap domain-containing protein n=1 Tax=Aliidongia sp. TaxID=1914230 RepID=UPI002DDDBB00|nr:hypothetical protein [Aliidongia sp.]HEV2673358.1 hypothetical protein [Aliidongia sp.]
MFFLAGASNGAMAQDAALAAITRGAAAVLLPNRENRDGILTVSDNTLYVQCLNRADTSNWRCEAAGPEAQPWLRNVLTADRQEMLIARGFEPDSTIGNFVRLFPRSTPPDNLASIILAVLTRIYDADAGNIRVLANWLPARPCHRRIMARHDRGGSIAAPHWGFAQDVASGCEMVDKIDTSNHGESQATTPGAPSEGEIDLDQRYRAAITLQIERLKEKRQGVHVWAIFAAGIPYVQCKPALQENAIYCEAASVDAVGDLLTPILTPTRRQKLVDAGFEPPGKVVNFRRFYGLEKYDATAIAHAILAVLHDCYGYGGTPPLMLKTEKMDENPL